MKLSSYIFLLGVLFVSCNNNIVFEDYKTFEDNEWHTDSIVVFNCSIKDTSVENTIKIKLRHSVDYEFQNLFLFVELEAVDTVELMLANKEGMWLGTGIGDIREFEFEYQHAKLFNKKGEYSFAIEQAMRYGATEKIEVLNNIMAVGLSIEKKDD